MRRGFTLVEILVVIAIIALLAGLTIANLGKLFGGSQIDIARLFVNQSMKTPLVTYRLQMGGYPSTEEGLQALIVAPAGKADRWRGPYLTEGTQDPDTRPLGRALPVPVSRASTTRTATTSGQRAPTRRTEPMTTSATGERGGFTLIEILLALALDRAPRHDLHKRDQLPPRGAGAPSPDEQFWKACAQARKEALEEQRSVLMSFDTKSRGFVLSDGAQQRALPVAGPDDLAIDFHPGQSDSSSSRS